MISIFIISFSKSNLSFATQTIPDRVSSSEISIENNLTNSNTQSSVEKFIPAEITLSEVNFKNSEEDFLKFTVKSSSAEIVNLKGLEFYDDKVFKTIEKDFLVKSPTEITLFFNLNQPDSPAKNEIYTTHSGLTATTEQIILKQNTHYYDFLCWQKSPISKTEILDFQKIFQADFWDNNDASSCIDSNSISKDQSIFRLNDQHLSKAWNTEVIHNNDSDISTNTEEQSEYSDADESSEKTDSLSSKTIKKSSKKTSGKSSKSKSVINTLAEELAEFGPEQLTEERPEVLIQITEIMPAPLQAKDSKSKPEEWIEIHNLSEENIDLSGWIIDDSDGGSKPHIIESRIIAPDQYLLLNSSETKLNLNNGSDQVRLFDNQKNLIDAVEYQEAEKNSSYSLITIDDKNEWSWQKTATPELANPNFIAIAGTIVSTPIFETPYHFQIETNSQENSNQESPALKKIYQINFDEQTIKAPLAKNIFTVGTSGKFIGQLFGSTDHSENNNDDSSSTEPASNILTLSQYQIDQTEPVPNNNSLPSIIIVIIIAVGVCLYYLVKNKQQWIKLLSGKSQLPS